MTEPHTEAEARQHLIDTALELAGWDLADPTQVTEELDIDLRAAGRQVRERPRDRYHGHQFADYALIQRGLPAAVVEAKKTSRDARVGQEQARQYAENLQRIHGGAVPFVFYSNGHEHFFWDVGMYPPSRIYGFPSRDDVDWMSRRRDDRRPLSVEMINPAIAGRDYQIEGIRTILEAIEAKRRKFLMVMATGTGKTRTAAGLIDVLLRARWAKRVLFLVDRVALRDQALDAFKEHLPNAPRWPDDGETVFARNRRLYVTTYPTMLNLIQAGTTPETWISPFFFDLIIADESHRSIYNTYKQVVQYFHGLTLGLTATPRIHVDHDTFTLFDCPAGDPTFAYSYEEAIRHRPPYLSEFEVLKVRSKFQIEGIHGPQLEPIAQEQLTIEGFDLQTIDFEGTDLEQKVTNSGTNGIIVREFMEESIKDQDGTLPGKSIVFAVSVRHARKLQELFDQMYPEHAGRLAQVLVSDDSRVHGKGGLLDQFKHRPMPRVAISVDMLDSGVDVPEVVNLVLAKPVYSYVKFWQMIGRGTRILQPDAEKRKPWCVEKAKFLIIDCWGNFEYFDENAAGREPGGQTPLPVRLFRARIEALKAALERRLGDVAAGIAADLRADLAALPENNVVVLEAGRELSAVRGDRFWERLRPDDLDHLHRAIAPLLRARSDGDGKAMRFEVDVVQYGEAVLLDNRDLMAALRATIVEQVDELPLSVNLVGRERAMIEAVQTDAWWVAADHAALRSMVERLAPLMRFRQRRPEAMMSLNLADVLALRESVPGGPGASALPIAAYRDRAERAVQAMVASNRVLQKLQVGAPISDEELRGLAAQLQATDPGIDEERLRKVYDIRSGSLVQLLRHVLGLEQLESWTTMVSREFDQLIATHTFSALQIQFLRMIKTFLIQTGKLERQHLVDRPFTQLHPAGVRGVFPPAVVDEILAVADRLAA